MHAHAYLPTAYAEVLHETEDHSTSGKLSIHPSNTKPLQRYAI